jgi:hypothetical protein
MRTIGVSKKVKIPSIALGLVGAALVAASVAVEGLDGLRDTGVTLIAASPISGLLGYLAPAAPVAR